MTIYTFSALMVGLIWAWGGMISVVPARHLGAIRFNMYRLIMVTAMLAIAATILGSWHTLMVEDLASALVLSGFVGIFLGDTALFATLRRMGPRRTSVLFSTNAPFVTLMGWAMLSETIDLVTGIGISLVFFGVTMAIIFGQRQSDSHDLEDVRGPLWVGVALGLLAAICQAAGIILSRPIMEHGADPVAASAVRVGIAALALMVIAPFRRNSHSGEDTGHSFGYILMRTGLSGFVGMGIGMTLFLFSLKGGNSGVIATLSATTPVWVLPLVWLQTKKPPTFGACMGAILVVAGCGLIFGIL